MWHWTWAGLGRWEVKMLVEVVQPLLRSLVLAPVLAWRLRVWILLIAGGCNVWICCFAWTVRYLGVVRAFLHSISWLHWSRKSSPGLTWVLPLYIFPYANHRENPYISCSLPLSRLCIFHSVFPPAQPISGKSRFPISSLGPRDNAEEISPKKMSQWFWGREGFPVLLESGTRRFC